MVAHPCFLQTRSCAIDAYGSSSHGFATPRLIEWTVTTGRNG